MNLNLISLITFILIIGIGCSSLPPKNITNVCEIFKEKKSWYKAAKKTEERWKVPIPVTMAFIKQESSFIAGAKPPRTKLLGFIPWKRPTSAKGYAQVIDGTWEMYLEDRGGWFRDRRDFEDAVDFIGWYNYKSHKSMGISLKDARSLYLVYHEGKSGFRKGNHRKKPWLLNVADKVQRQSDRYNAQYQGCKKKLGRSFFIFF
ncbi:MAG: transglycosylase [SAR86 cluster bacterium]|jgi:hypothetical protein|nr:transglycosylase [SAR86 cluster bacterium]|tara:strand:+ start:1319 stop:1927 length:609 start_codon:yes stop_codon:yes gene_type:complete